MTKSQTKSKERVRDHGEVFTAEREVKAMCDLVKDETERIDSRFLEPACGDGNFLAEIIMRKMQVVKRKYKQSHLDYEKNAVLAISSIYGVDILQDNVDACRERMFSLWNNEYTSVCKGDANDETRDAVKYMLSKNIVCGNALTLNCVDENGNDTAEPIIFPEWSFVMNSQIKRRDFRFDVLLKENEDSSMYDTQLSLFDDAPSSFEYWMIDPITNEVIPRPVKEFPPIHYRRVQENE